MSAVALIRNWKFLAIFFGTLVLVWLGVWLGTKSLVTGLLVDGVIACGLVILILIEILVGRIRAKKIRNTMLAQSRIPGGESSASLVQSFSDGLGRLGNQLGKDFLYTYPWYVIIGEPASGKTTSIAESRIPLALTDKQQGVGGTLNCDWWFTNEAIIIDIAGRLAVNERLQNVWEKFLLLLKKARPRRPIDGLIIAIPADKLVASEENQREAISAAEKMAEALRTRVAELQSKLDVIFPVHILITKCDKIRGFEETFALLPDQQKSTLFGWSNPTPVNADLPPNWIDDFYESVCTDIEKTRADVFPPDKIRASSNLIYLFEEEFRALRPVLDIYLRKLFDRRLQEERPLLRGIFLSSGGQDKTQLSSLFVGGAQQDEEPESPKEEARSRENADATFDLGSSGGKGKKRKLWGRPYFVHDFYSEKVFKESGLVRPTRKAGDTISHYVKYTKIAAVVLGSLGLIYLISSFVSSHGALSLVEKRVTRVRDETQQQENPLSVRNNPLPGAYEILDQQSGSFGLFVSPGELTRQIGETLDLVMQKSFDKSLESWPNLDALQNARDLVEFDLELRRLSNDYTDLQSIAGTEMPLRDIAKILLKIFPRAAEGLRETLQTLSGDATYLSRLARLRVDISAINRRFQGVVQDTYKAQVKALRNVDPSQFSAYQNLHSKAAEFDVKYSKVKSEAAPTLGDSLALAAAIEDLDAALAAQNAAFKNHKLTTSITPEKKEGGLLDKAKKAIDKKLGFELPLAGILTKENEAIVFMLQENFAAKKYDKTIESLKELQGSYGKDWSWRLDSGHDELFKNVLKGLVSRSIEELEASRISQVLPKATEKGIAELRVRIEPPGILARLRKLNDYATALGPRAGVDDSNFIDRFNFFQSRVEATRAEDLSTARQTILKLNTDAEVAAGLSFYLEELKVILDREVEFWKASNPIETLVDGSLPTATNAVERKLYVANLQLLTVHLMSQIAKLNQLPKEGRASPQFRLWAQLLEDMGATIDDTGAEKKEGKYGKYLSAVQTVAKFDFPISLRNNLLDLASSQAKEELQALEQFTRPDQLFLASQPNAWREGGDAKYFWKPGTPDSSTFSMLKRLCPDASPDNPTSEWRKSLQAYRTKGMAPFGFLKRFTQLEPARRHGIFGADFDRTPQGALKLDTENLLLAINNFLISLHNIKPPRGETGPRSYGNTVGLIYNQIKDCDAKISDLGEPKNIKGFLRWQQYKLYQQVAVNLRLHLASKIVDDARDLSAEFNKFGSGFPFQEDSESDASIDEVIKFLKDRRFLFLSGAEGQAVDSDTSVVRFQQLFEVCSELGGNEQWSRLFRNDQFMIDFREALEKLRKVRDFLRLGVVESEEQSKVKFKVYFSAIPDDRPSMILRHLSLKCGDNTEAKLCGGRPDDIAGDSFLWDLRSVKRSISFSIGATAVESIKLKPDTKLGLTADRDRFCAKEKITMKTSRITYNDEKPWYLLRFMRMFPGGYRDADRKAKNKQHPQGHTLVFDFEYKNLNSTELEPSKCFVVITFESQDEDRPGMAPDFTITMPELNVDSSWQRGKFEGLDPFEYLEAFKSS